MNFEIRMEGPAKCGDSRIGSFYETAVPKEDEDIVSNREKEIQYFVQSILYDSISRYLNTGEAIGTRETFYFPF